jgi:cyclophilin family peptidyl-prolyl cis-trans isomerase
MYRKRDTELSKRWLRLIVLVLALILVVAACGDDENDEPTVATTTSTGSETSATEQTVNPTVATADETPAGDAGTGGDAKTWDTAPEMQLVEGTDYRAVLHTNKGDITIDILEDEAPIAANNFVFLAQQGYYTDVPFHRVIEGFMIQGGDPEGTGMGGPGYTIQDEPVVGEYTRGAVAMARTALPNSAGSQFFIMHQDYPLDKVYVIFGQVTEGMDVVDAIATVPVGQSASGEPSVPLEPVTLESVDILTD